MKVICTTVVRAAKQGDIHGGLYLIDTDSEKVLHHAPYEKDFINDNERGGERGLRGIAVLDDRIIVADSAGFIELDKNLDIKRTFQDSNYFKSIHEIVFHEGYIWATSTAYDAVVKLDLDFNIQGFWEILGENVDNHKKLTGKKQITPETKTENDNYHINSLFVAGGNLRVSGLLTPLYNFDDMTEVCPVPTVSMIDDKPGGNQNSFVHNFYEYENVFLANLTSYNAIGFFDKGFVGYGWYNNVSIPRAKNVRYQVDEVAKNNWNRGLAKLGNKLVIGSSPARILIYDMQSRKFEKEIVLEKDIRHAIHGLEILE
jgi:hypothetical protein|tara:strand:- start:14050 stop:14994 length:945 start_codon:yes stop_codon:yes gene_type:complete